MNWEHLRAILWLNSRIKGNRMKQASNLSITVQKIFLVLGMLIAIGAFAGMLAVGYKFLSHQSSLRVMLAWDGLVVVFMFFWLLMLSMELQRSEVLPLEKFMHYPISVSGLFLINYAASVWGENTSRFLFIPAMLGLSAGLVLGRGAAMLWLFPLLFAFLLMVTAVTYQFRGWLAIVMLNKRHRRTVVTLVTLVTVLIFQVPFLSTRVFGSRRPRSAPTSQARRANPIQRIEEYKDVVVTATELIPMGWLPYGAMSSAEGNFLPVLLGIGGMTLIGGFSLHRSYRTTVRLYSGNYGSGKTRSVAKTVPGAGKKNVARPVTAFLEMKLPWVPERAMVVALATLRSLTRAPEAKMILLSPIIMSLFFGASIIRLGNRPSEFSRPLMVSALLALIFFGLSQLAGNQFAFDRSGFRNYVLASAPRRDILLGKNLAVAPVMLGLAAIVQIWLQWAFPMRIDHFIAVLIQTITMFLLYCMLTNFLSIVNPLAMAAGSLKPAVRPTLKTILLSILTLILYPMAFLPALIPLGLEFGLHWMGWYPGLPIFMLMSMIELIGVGFVYSAILDRQGKLLQSRELKILGIVAVNVGDG